MWDFVEPSKEWVMSQVPGVVKQHMHEHKDYDPEAQRVRRARHHLLDARQTVDMASVRQAYCNVVVG